MSCHAVLKNLYEPKMDVILTIRFKITAEIEITKHMLCPTLQTRTCIGVLKSIIMFFHSFIAMEYAFTLFFLLLIARLMRLAIILPTKVSRRRHQIKDFSQIYVVSLCDVVVRCSRVEPMVLGSSPVTFFFSFFLFFPFFVLLFSINIQLNNCYLIKCNKRSKNY